MDAITKAHDSRLQMIDTSIVRVHQQGASAKRGLELIVSVIPAAGHCSPSTPPKDATEIFVIGKQWMWHVQHGNGVRENNTLHVPVGRPIKLTLTAGQVSDIASAADLIKDLPEGAMLLADKGYDANALRNAVIERKAWANIPPKANRKDPICFSKHLYKARNLVERFFNRIKHYRRIATRYDKTAENFLAALKPVAVRVWLRGNESPS